MATSLVELLKRKRDEKQLSQDAVAKAIGKSLRAYQYYEDGKTTPKAETLEKLSDVLGFELKEIYENAKKLHIPQTVKENVLQEPEAIYGNTKDLLQVITNLSYQGNTNADSIKQMAATNERNSQLMAAMFAQMFPNSKIVAQVIVSPDEIRKMSNESYETFLREQNANKDEKHGK